MATAIVVEDVQFNFIPALPSSLIVINPPSLSSRGFSLHFFAIRTSKCVCVCVCVRLSCVSAVEFEMRLVSGYTGEGVLMSWRKLTHKKTTCVCLCECVIMSDQTNLLFAYHFICMPCNAVNNHKTHQIFIIVKQRSLLCVSVYQLSLCMTPHRRWLRLSIVAGKVNSNSFRSIVLSIRRNFHGQCIHFQRFHLNMLLLLLFPIGSYHTLQ